MKRFLLYSISLAFIFIAFSSCSDWIRPEKLKYEHIGGYQTLNNAESEEYYAALRKYKDEAIGYGRPVAFGWFSNWAPSGPIRKGYLSAVPDSMDIISMWSGAPDRFTITPEQKADKEFVQKVKGIKLLEVSLLSHLGKGRTPSSIYAGLEEKKKKEGWTDEEFKQAMKFARWDFWGFKSHDLSNTEELNAALSKFAKALCDSLVANDWDGYDIDWEPGAGFNDADGTIGHGNIAFLIKEMGKYIGPKSDPDNKGHKLLCVDGEISYLPAELNDYVDYWILQTYGQSQPGFNAPGNDPKKVIITENFERSYAGGGNLLKQAARMPETGYKGGFGAYRFDNDYDNVPDYKWMRQGIRINQNVFKEWKKSQQ